MGHFATYAQVSSAIALTSAADHLKTAKTRVIAHMNDYFDREQMDDDTFRVTSCARFSADILSTLQQAVPAAELRALKLSDTAQQKELDGPAHKTVLVLHIVHPTTDQKHYHPWESELLPSLTMPYNSATSPFGTHISHSPSRVVWRLTRSALGHYELTSDLVVSGAATPSGLIGPDPGHHPVRWIKSRGQPRFFSVTTTSPTTEA